MKKYNLIAAMLAAAIGSAALSGCSKKTAPTLESVIASAEERNNAASSQDLDMLVVCSFEVGQMGITAEATVTADLKAQETKDPLVAHVYGDMGMSVLGTEQSYSIDSYSARDGESYVSYTNMVYEEEESGWMKKTLDGPSMDISSGINNFGFIADEPDNYTFTVNEDGTCSVTGAVGGEQFNALFSEDSEISSIFSEMGIELGSMSYDFDMVFSPVSGQNGSYELTSCSLALTEPFSVEEEGVEITFSRMDMSVVVNGYDTVEAIEIPEEALMAEEIEY